MMLTLVYFVTLFEFSQVTDLALDPSSDPKIRLNFNITMLDLKCDWAVIDVVSALGTDQNVSVHLSKWTIDADGVRQQFGGRNRDQKDIDLHDTTVTETIEELHANGEDAISVDEHTLEYAKKENDYLFVDFYAGWCSHCRDLAPTWEALAELMYDAGEQLDDTRHPDDYDTEDYEAAEKVELPVMIAKVDCVNHPKLCNRQEGIRAYPTLRLFVDGKQWKGGDYKGHRTLLEMVEWLYLVEEEHKAHMDESERSLHVAHRGTKQDLTAHL
jgi:thiol-disulfide isomerase/thioredoxin